jgi:hypothetical protein
MQQKIMKKNNWLITAVIAVLITISTPSCAMSEKIENTNQRHLSEQKALSLKGYKTAEELQRELEIIYPNGSDLDKIVSDLNLNKQSKINNEINGNVILYRLYDGSKNIHGYNYWKISIKVNSENRIEQISVNSADYQGS